MNENKEIIFFESSDGEVALETHVRDETVWLTLDQMATLFQRNKSTISRHIKNTFDEEELQRISTVAKFATVQIEGGRKVSRDIDFYNLDVIISVGYRVKSQRGVEFRKWATSVLKDYVLKGYAENKRRLQQLNQVLNIMQRTPRSLESGEIIQVVKSYTRALDLLDNYDHQSLVKPKGIEATYVLEYGECKDLISKMKFAKDSDLFGIEKDDSSSQVYLQYIKGLTTKTFILQWKKKLQIYFILLLKIIHFMMETSALLLRFFCIFLTRIMHCLLVTESEFPTTLLLHQQS